MRLQRQKLAVAIPGIGDGGDETLRGRRIPWRDSGVALCEFAGMRRAFPFFEPVQSRSRLVRCEGFSSREFGQRVAPAEHLRMTLGLLCLA